MSSPRKDIDKLWEQRAAAMKPPVMLDLTKVLFKAQLPFGLASGRWQTACNTRRSGKTVGIVSKLLRTAQDKPGSVSLYISLSRKNAKQLAWGILKTINTQYEVGGVPNESDLSLTLPNGSIIYCTGCNDLGEVEKFRGLPLAIVVIDEAQSFPSVLLRRLIDEVIAPALMDYAGALVLAGTPSPVPTGYFYEQTQSLTYEHFSWSVFDNPYIKLKSGKTPQELLDEELKRRGVTVDDPVIQREWFGKWKYDPDSLVFKFNPAVNCRTRPALPPCDQHVIGVDLGFDDADAIEVLGWSKNSPQVDLVHEDVVAHQGITALCNKLKPLYDRYKPLALVIDTGGLGKKVTEEIQMRTGLPLEPADKQRKREHIEWVNDALRTQHLWVPPDSRFASDALKLEWDKSNPEKWEISERFHSDAADALLYAYVKALGWLEKPKPPPPPPINSMEWYQAHMAQKEAELNTFIEEQIERNKAQVARENARPENELDWL